MTDQKPPEGPLRSSEGLLAGKVPVPSWADFEAASRLAADDGGTFVGIPVVESRLVPPGHFYLTYASVGPVIFWPAPTYRAPWWRRLGEWLLRCCRWGAYPWWIPPGR